MQLEQLENVNYIIVISMVMWKYAPVMCLLCLCNVMILLSVKNQHLDYSTDLVQISVVDWKSSFAFNYVNMNLFGSGFISIWSLTC